MLDRKFWVPATVLPSTHSGATWFPPAGQNKLMDVSKGKRIGYICCSRGCQVDSATVLSSLDLT
eukprot:750280-Pyramimonas_sp.AAC.1